MKRNGKWSGVRGRSKLVAIPPRGKIFRVFLISSNEWLMKGKGAIVEDFNLKVWSNIQCKFAKLSLHFAIPVYSILNWNANKFTSEPPKIFSIKKLFPLMHQQTSSSCFISPDFSPLIQITHHIFVIAAKMLSIFLHNFKYISTSCIVRMSHRRQQTSLCLCTVTNLNFKTPALPKNSDNASWNEFNWQWQPSASEKLSSDGGRWLTRSHQKIIGWRFSWMKIFSF